MTRMTLEEARRRMLELADAADDIRNIENKIMRHKGGFWLHSQLEEVWDDTHLMWTKLDEDNFNMLLVVLFEAILHDATEDVSVGPQFDIDLSQFRS